MEIFNITGIIPIILFASFLFTGLAGGRLKPMVSGITGTLSIFIVTAVSYYTAYKYFFEFGKAGNEYIKIIPFNLMWLQFNDTLFINMGILLDPISVMMLIVISTVSLMVHLYSLGYMKGETGFARFYSFLSLFTFSMISLVISTNLFQTYIFWELVGISSYLLIGYYYSKPSAVAASKKAFIVTRFADLGFLIGILILSYITKTFEYTTLTDPNGSAINQGSSVLFLGLSAMNVTLILIFIGCAGKSAMFPLHIWLPDAMEGPTPVSALIHAATMVVAGVYLIARLFPLYIFSGADALNVIAFIGTFTSLFAALIATTQMDIKRILAFSTISQIGFMIMSLGVSGYGDTNGLGFTASMFHLFTHAMFKALLFLCAGAVIHAIHLNNLNEMGGLRKYLPVTHITFLIACLAISGIPPFSGFFSKDEILTAAFAKNKLIFTTALITAGITAFYMFRLYFGIFWNKEVKYDKTPHEAPKTMTTALIILAVGSAITGFIPFGNFVSSNGVPLESHIHFEIAIPAVITALVGIFVAYIFYKKENNLPVRVSSAVGGLYGIIYRKFFIDEIYIFITKGLIFRFISGPVVWFDRHIVDGTMNGIAFITNLVSEKIKYFQSGQVQQYAYVMLSGIIIIVITVIYILSNL
ncbi:MAG: NADH-quinone oxidoreductase subunit L [Ignavibacteria bacterium]|nr:NADH-quinone oxidoreductase subunit L [Ignavibacteria bacterium]